MVDFVDLVSLRTTFGKFLDKSTETITVFFIKMVHFLIENSRTSNKNSLLLQNYTNRGRYVRFM